MLVGWALRTFRRRSMFIMLNIRSEEVRTLDNVTVDMFKPNLDSWLGTVTTTIKIQLKKVSLQARPRNTC